MKYQRKRILLIILSGFALVIQPDIPGSYAQGNPPDFTGTWKTDRRCVPYTVTLAQIGNEVTGTYSPGNGRIFAGAVTNGKLTFKWTEDGAEGFGEFSVNWDGKGFAGTSSTVKSSGGWVVTWKTSGPPVTPFAGTWETYMQGKNPFPLTMVQSGDHVKGLYQNNGKLEGTISGKVLRFTWRSDAGTGSGRFVMEEKNRSFSGTYNRGSNPDEVESTWSGRLAPDSEGVAGPCDPLSVVYGYPKDIRQQEGRGTGNLSEAELAKLHAEFEERMKNAPATFAGVWRTKSGDQIKFPELLFQQANNKVSGFVFGNRPELGHIRDGIVERNTLRFTVWRPSPLPSASSNRDEYMGVGELVMDVDGRSFRGTIFGVPTTGTLITR